jgi:WD40 repeat protein/serine/threonine protein kinase
MSTNTSSADYGRFEELAEEFAARFRRGERPGLQEYIDRCPDLADEIRELFPALVEVERVKEDQPAPPGAREVVAALPSLGQVGDYQVLREVGRGGMGVVYEAEQVSLGRRVALKVLPRNVASDLKTLARFRREARSAAQLHHTNIVPVFEVGRDGEVSYYAMQFIQGQGLDAVIDELLRLNEHAHRTGPARDPAPPDAPIPAGPTGPDPSRSRQVSRMARSLLTGRFVPETPGGSSEVQAHGADREATAALSDHRDPEETDAPPASGPCPLAASSPPSSVVLPGGSQLSAVESGRRPFYRSVAQIGRQVAAGLAYAHARGIVHRDIKPSNLLLDTEGVVWITDFGLAKASDDGLTGTGDILGTLRYMAPERFRGEADGRADVYALGLTLYELLTLRPAFDAPDRLKLIEQIKAEDPPRPRALDSRIPRDLETIVLKASAKDAKDRYPTADALGEDLRRYLADEPIKARRVGALERTWIWAKRRPAAAALLLVSAVAVLTSVGAGVAFAYNSRLEAALGEAEFQRYYRHIAQAAAGWREGNMAQVEELLDNCPTDRRDWEWNYLKRLCHTDLLTLRGHADTVYSVAYGPDGTRLASGSWDDSVRIWDAITGGEVLAPLRGHTDDVCAVAYSPDGRRLASASYDKTVRVWDALTGREVWTLRGHTGPVLSVAFSPDGRRLISGGVETDFNDHANFNDNPTVRVWDLTTGQEFPEFLVIPFKGQWQWNVFGVAYSPDGRWLAAASPAMNVLVWNATTGKVKHEIDFSTSGAMAVAFSPDGRRLASASMEGTITIWDVATGQPLRTLTGHASGLTSVAFSPDGRRLTTSSLGGVIKVWDRDATSAEEPRTPKDHSWQSSQEPLTLKGHTSSVHQVCFSPDGTRLASASADGTIKVWDARSDPEARTFEGLLLAVSPDGRWLASTRWNAPFKLWDTTTGQEIPTSAGRTGQDSSLVFSPDGAWLATGSPDGKVKLWDAASGRLLHTFEGHTGEVYNVAFSPNGRWLASASHDTTVKLWNVATGQPIRTLRGHQGPVFDVAFSSDGTRLASASQDRTVRLWDVTTCKEVPFSPLELEGPYTRLLLAFSPDGTRLTSATRGRTIKVWDARTGQPLRPFEGNTAPSRPCLHGPYGGVAFTPDGKRLASASEDGAVKLWDVGARQEALLLRGHISAVRGVAFSPDGTRLASTDHDCRGRLWDARPWTPEAAVEREALGLLDSLFAMPLRKADVLEYLRNARTIRPPARELALSLVDRYREETNPETYHRESWARVRQPYLNTFQYRFALLQAEHACHLAPDRPGYRTGLGAALYRAGRYREAIETLAGADRLDKDSPARQAFLAMAHRRLGQHEQARALLVHLRQVLDQPRRTKDAQTLDLMDVAEALIAPPPPTEQ